MNKYELFFFATFIIITGLYNGIVMFGDHALLCIASMLYILYGLWFTNYLVYMTSKAYKKKREKYMKKG